jgi:hypothetical protein
MSVVGDSTMGIIGQGDSTKKKDAEKLAATSALLQLEAAGVVSDTSWKVLMNSSPKSRLAGRP